MGGGTLRGEDWRATVRVVVWAGGEERKRKGRGENAKVGFCEYFFLLCQLRPLVPSPARVRLGSGWHTLATFFFSYSFFRPELTTRLTMASGHFGGLGEVLQS